MLQVTVAERWRAKNTKGVKKGLHVRRGFLLVDTRYDVPMQLPYYSLANAERIYQKKYWHIVMFLTLFPKYLWSLLERVHWIFIWYLKNDFRVRSWFFIFCWSCRCCLECLLSADLVLPWPAARQPQLLRSSWTPVIGPFADFIGISFEIG